MRESQQTAVIAKNIAALYRPGEKFTVRFDGHADMRCTESRWQGENGPNYGNTTRTWCSPRRSNGVTPQGIKISSERAETVKRVVRRILREEYPSVDQSVITFVTNGLAEDGHWADAAECVRTENSRNCLHDRRVDVWVPERACIGPCDTPDTIPVPETEPELTTTTTPTTTPTPTPTPPPPTTLPPRPNESVQYLPSRAFQNAQQNSDQRITVKAVTLSCPECQQPPSSASGVMYGWSATLDASTVSFTLTPPSGYATPRDYKITSNPSGKSALSDQTAVMRFYTATRSGAPYRYSVTSTVNYTMRLWKLEGTTLTYVQEEPMQQTNTRGCSPSSCSFGVLGSNVG